ncbi:MAG: divergent polysaccharide deacetylase family protein [Alphaproteobacteria bacterium]
MKRFVPRKVRSRPQGAAWVRHLRQEAPRRRAEAMVVLLKSLGIPVPSRRRALPVLIGVIFVLGITFGIGVALLTGQTTRNTIEASTPRSQERSVEPVLVEPAPSLLKPSTRDVASVGTDVHAPSQVPQTFSPPAFLMNEVAPERGEETAQESYRPPGESALVSAPVPVPVPDAQVAETPPPVPTVIPPIPVAPPIPPAPIPLHRPFAIASPPTLPVAPRGVEAPSQTESHAEGLPWQRFAVPAPPPDGRPRVAVVIDDLGVDRGRSMQIVKLPGPLTASYLTYAHDLAGQTHAALAAGHELMIHVPMEPKNQSLNPGPDVLLTRHDNDRLRHLLAGMFSLFKSYVGINNHMGSLFTSDARGMTVVMQELKNRGLLFLDSRTANNSVGGEVARHAGVPYAVRDVFLDNEPEVAHIQARLSELEHIARSRGYAVAIGHPRDGTIEALRAWLPTLHQKGLVLVPISAIIRQRMNGLDKVAAQPRR